LTPQDIDSVFAFGYVKKPNNAVVAWSDGGIQSWAGLMNCKATLAGAALAAGASALAPRAGWPATITIPSHIDGGCCSISAGSDLQDDPAGKGESGVPITVNEAGSDWLATRGRREGGADLLAIGASSGPDAAALGSVAETGDNGPDAVASVADPEPSTLTKLLIAFSDLRSRVFGGP
jgi:hypothetical protein